MISIIIPVYNAENFLCSTVDSILSQNSLDYELLLIDDGSKDKSGKICDEYARQDGRVRVFHKKNGGVSSARNLGLDNAKGEWVSFVDADDWVSGIYFSEGLLDTSNDLVLNKISNQEYTSNNLDDVCWDFYIEAENKKYFIKGYSVYPIEIEKIYDLFEKMQNDF